MYQWSYTGRRVAEDEMVRTTQARTARPAGKPCIPFRVNPTQQLVRDFAQRYTWRQFKRGARVLVVDDLLATGGSASAACQLVEDSGRTVVRVGFLVELGFLMDAPGWRNTMFFR